MAQLFMCGMWLLMQFAVMGLYWDIPPLDSFPEQQMPLREVRGEEDEPLMSLEDEDRMAVADSYGSLNPEQTETQLSSQIPPSPPDSPPPDTSDPFENFSASRGEVHQLLSYAAVVVVVFGRELVRHRFILCSI